MAKIVDKAGYYAFLLSTENWHWDELPKPSQGDRKGHTHPSLLRCCRPVKETIYRDMLRFRDTELSALLCLTLHHRSKWENTVVSIEDTRKAFKCNALNWLDRLRRL